MLICILILSLFDCALEAGKRLNQSMKVLF